MWAKSKNSQNKIYEKSLGMGIRIFKGEKSSENLIKIWGLRIFEKLVLDIRLNSYLSFIVIKLFFYFQDVIKLLLRTVPQWGDVKLTQLAIAAGSRKGSMIFSSCTYCAIVCKFSREINQLTPTLSVRL